MFDEYLDSLSEDQRAALHAVIEHVATVAPSATPGRSYGMPAFLYRDKPLLGFRTAAQHLSVFPFSPDAVDAVAARLNGFSLSKGTVRFTPNKPIPPDVLTDLVQARMREIDLR